MQVLILAVQNAVDYADLGVATSGATLFRSIGGSLGTAVLGAIFANRLTSELKSVLPAGVAGHASTAAARSTRRRSRSCRRCCALAICMPSPTRSAPSSSWRPRSRCVAFALSWFIRQLPLRETVASPDMADTFASPRGSDSLAVVIDQIGRLDRREGAREIIRRIALRAGVELDPAACWLLARLCEDAPVSLSTLADRAHVEVAALDRARDRLLELGLIAPDLGATSSHEPTARRPGCRAHLRADRRRPQHAGAPEGDRRTALEGPARVLAPRPARGSRSLDRQPRARVLHRRLGLAQGRTDPRGGSCLLSERQARKMTPPPILLAVPNVSEGRDRAKVAAIGSAFAARDGCAPAG